MTTTSTIRDGYLTSRDGLSLYYRQRIVPDERTHVVLAHGVAEHYGRYRHLEQFLTDRGIGFSMMDLRGHGQSEGRRIFTPSFDAYLDDMDLLVDHVSSHTKQIVLVGHSLGGIIAIRYAQTRPNAVSALATSGAALRALVVPPRPVFGLLKRINKLYSATPVPGLVKPEQICRSPEIVARYISDPLVPKYMTTGFAVATLDACEAALAQAHTITMPALIMHGGGDQIADAKASEQFFGSLGSEDKKLAIYPNLYHEIFNEPEREKVMTELADWALERPN